MISDERKLRVEAALKENGIDVSILWDTSELHGRDYTVIVKCNLDGEEECRHVSSLRKGMFQCRQCLKNKYVAVLRKFNMSFVQFTKGKDCSFVEFSCDTCGETRSLSVGNILNMKRIKCHGCRNKKIIELLESRGCTFIDMLFDKFHSKNQSQCRIVYKDVTGNLRSVLETNLLRGAFASVESHWEQKHFLYVFKSKDQNYPYLKIGTANDPVKRLADLKLDFDCDIISIQFDSRYAANKEEGRLHKLFYDNRLDGSIAKEFTKGLSTYRKDGSRIKMGYTEWFDSCVYAAIVSELNTE